MKVQGYKVDDFIKNIPAGIRGMLLYGPDRGLGKERLDTIITNLGLDKNDDFNTTRLLGDDVAGDSGLIAGSASQVSLMGGRHLVILNDGNDKSTPAIEQYLEIETDAILLCTADDLKTSSSFRKIFENENNLASLPCYKDDDKAISMLLRNTMGENNIAMENDAFNYAVQNMGTDRAFTRMEIEKLILYAGSEKKLSLSDVQNCMIDSAEHGLDDLVYACGNGDFKQIDIGVDNALAEGASGIGVLRIVATHFMKIHRAKLDMEMGKTVEDVSRGVFFKRINQYKAQVKRISKLNSLRAIKVLQDAEYNLKQTGNKEHTILSKSLYTVARLSSS